MVRGSPGQVLTVTENGLDLEWADPSVVEGGGGGGIPNDNSVTTIKIVDGAVTTAKLGDGAVTGVKIGTTTIGSGNIADNAITTNKINNLAVSAAKIADTTITSGKLASDAIITAKIADSQVTNAKLAGSISNDKLLQITDKAKLPNDAVYTADLTASNSLPHPEGGRYGAYHGSDLTFPGAWGEGIFTDNLTGQGTYSEGANSHLFGPYAVMTSAASSNSNAGMRTTRAIGSRGINAKLFAKLRLTNTADVNMWFGFKDTNSVGTSTYTNALDSQHGAFMGLHSSDSNIKKSVNDATASSTSSDFSTGIAKTGLTAWHIFGVELNTSGNNVLFSLRNAANPTTPITQSVTTTLPSTTAKLFAHITLQTKVASSKALEVAWVYAKISDGLAWS
jgi:hypothetical protein